MVEHFYVHLSIPNEGLKMECLLGRLLGISFQPCTLNGLKWKSVSDRGQRSAVLGVCCLVPHFLWPLSTGPDVVAYSLDNRTVIRTRQWSGFELQKTQIKKVNPYSPA